MDLLFQKQKKEMNSFPKILLRMKTMIIRTFQKTTMKRVRIQKTMINRAPLKKEK
jgi:hypothetical protein